MAKEKSLWDDVSEGAKGIGESAVAQKLLSFLKSKVPHLFKGAADVAAKATPEGEAAAARFGAGWDQAVKGVPEAFKNLTVKMGGRAMPEAGAGLGAAKTILSAGSPIAMGLLPRSANLGEADYLKKKHEEEFKGHPFLQKNPGEMEGHTYPGSSLSPSNASELLSILKEHMGDKGTKAGGVKKALSEFKTEESKSGQEPFMKGKNLAKDQAIFANLLKSVFPQMKDEEVAQLLADVLGGTQIKGGKKYTAKSKAPTDKKQEKPKEPEKLSGVPGESGEDSLTVDKEDRNG
jgi:hypothetical protein